MRGEQRGRSLVTAAIALALLTGISVEYGAAAGPRDLIQTTEGKRLVWLWHTMIDHSSNVVYSPEHFAKLADDLDRAADDLRALAGRGVIDAETAAHLIALFDQRYDYVRAWQYTNRAMIEMSGIESSNATARYIIELQLCVLRRPVISKMDRELATVARENLARQLHFLAQLEAFEAESDRRRTALKEREEAGEKVDWERFDAEYAWRRKALVDAYENRKLPAVRWVSEMMPYVLALTEATPCPQPAEGTVGKAGP